MSRNDNMGDRMKAYENCYRFYLPRRQAVCVRLDGKAFHNFTKGFEKPYDCLFMYCMWETARELCKNIGGCVLGYTQSDEISLILVDYENINTEPWFDNNLQKIASVSASMATLFFNNIFTKEVLEESKDNFDEICKTHVRTSDKLALFDSRAFILPREEVVNYIYWRQTDCIRNSVQTAGRTYFSHKQLQGKSCDEIKQMLEQEKNIKWDNYSTYFKHGVMLYKVPCEVEHKNDDGTITRVMRNKWALNLETPLIINSPELVNSLVIKN